MDYLDLKMKGELLTDFGYFMDRAQFEDTRMLTAVLHNWRENIAKNWSHYRTSGFTRSALIEGLINAIWQPDAFVSNKASRQFISEALELVRLGEEARNEYSIEEALSPVRAQFAAVREKLEREAQQAKPKQKKATPKGPQAVKPKPARKGKRKAA